MRALLALPLLALPSCTSGDTPPGGPPDPYDVTVGPYEATVRRTAHGIPHIVADDVPSLMFGTGYAFAQDHVCTLADQILKIRSERSQTFGVGPDNVHWHSDVLWKALRVYPDAEEGWFRLPPELRDGLVGYAAGYNRYLEDVGPDGLPAPCRGAEWVRPVTHIDLLAYYLHLGQLGSGFYMADFIPPAAPPVDGSARRAPPRPLSDLGRALRPDGGSNAVALGARRTETGRGMVVSNSHFEAEGERRWYELHQTVPGELDVYGVALMGVPLVNMGFNEHVAWTHTVSTTPRFLLYQLELQPGNPTRYRYGDGWRDMTWEDVDIDVLTDDGSTIETRTHRIYRSHYGLMLDAPLIGWTGQVAFTYRDVNETNLEMIPAWWSMNRADSLDALIEAQSRQGIPWVHTVAADREGNAWFGDTGAAPNLRPEAEQAYRDWVSESFLARQFQAEGAYVFDGSDPVFEWVESDTAMPGAMPTEEHPQIRTDTWTINANENHWLTSDEPLEGYPMIFGEERAPRQGRTKITARFAAGLDPDLDLGDDGLFSLDELVGGILSYPAQHADVLKGQLVERCTGAEPVEIRWKGETRTVDLTEACDVLEAWDGSLRADSHGAHVFREWVGSGAFAIGGINPFLRAGDFDQRGAVFADDFDPERPLDTPATLATPAEGAPDLHLQALAEAVLQLEEAGIALDARLGDIQFREKGGERLAVPGGKELEGAMFIADWRTSNTTLLPREHAPRGSWLNPRTELTADGYPINGGDSWIAAIAFTDDGPEGQAIMTYSQSADPDSPFYNDQAVLHAEGRMRPILFDEADILADPALEEQTLVLE